MTTITGQKTLREVAESGGNPLGLKRIHHVEFWVGNAKQAAFYYRKAFGFSQVAYSGLETGNRQFASYVLGQGRVRFVLSTPSTRPTRPATTCAGMATASVTSRCWSPTPTSPSPRR